MEVIQNYYRMKSQINVNDEFHERISEKDLDILRKSLALVIITPFCSIALMYLAKEIKREYSFSGNFIFNVRYIK